MAKPNLTILELDGRKLAVLAFDPIPQLIRSALTCSELAIVAAVLQGKSNAEIAREREVAYRTVANQLARIYRKLEVSSRNELIARCLGVKAPE